MPTSFGNRLESHAEAPYLTGDSPSDFSTGNALGIVEQRQQRFTPTTSMRLWWEKCLTFWKCWRSKFESTNKCVEIDGCVDPNTIADKFANYFSNCFSCNNKEKAVTRDRPTYCGLPPVTDLCFDTECVSKVISVLKRGKAADIDGLTSEHILLSHPVLPVIITRLFQLILLTQHIPSGFKYSYIVPIPKLKDTRTKAYHVTISGELPSPPS